MSFCVRLIAVGLSCCLSFTATAIGFAADQRPGSGPLPGLLAFYQMQTLSLESVSGRREILPSRPCWIAQSRLGFVARLRDLAPERLPIDRLAEMLSSLSVAAFGPSLLVDNVQTWRQFLAESPNLYLLLNAEDTVLAFAQVSEGFEGHAHLANLAAETREGQKGYGTFLLESLLRDLRHRHIGILSWTSSIRAVSFYHRFLAPRVEYSVDNLTTFTAYLFSLNGLSDEMRRTQERYAGLLLAEMQRVSKRLGRLPAGEYLFRYRSRSAYTVRLQSDGQWTYAGKAIPILEQIMFLPQAALFTAAGKPLLYLSYRIKDKQRLSTRRDLLAERRWMAQNA